MCGFASRTASAPTALDPASDGPPVWNVEIIPSARPQATIGAASAPVLTDPSPISPMRRTPAAAISAKSASIMPSSRIGAPARTFSARPAIEWLGIAGAAVFALGLGTIGFMVLAEADGDWEHTPEYHGIRPAGGAA